ncbi:hypothetical protein [Brevundimonas nasdae]|uniref:Haem-binding uptake Tiki superfamily ChaN domain-containing protein n=1 Tax=Brevundimonas nasdae TaxID=172043 RepID=A0ABX8TIE9_9CAUL|nr:hypothetical protein [Brevundimonas nasdae]QYC09570.1 hypothetical protein KWG56_13345 [Brevundimonas nasdae]QYC15619.1 hypothetical protein KWG63_08670 [Brevundimonas nasdae]
MIAIVVAAAGLICTPPQGTDQLLARSERVIMVGEIHGTAEAPHAIGEIACAASEQEPVVVALELEDTLQPILDAFIAAPDAATAFATLEGSTLLNRAVQDGRTSEGLLALLHRVRVLKGSGRDIALHAFQPSSIGRGDSLDQAWYELNMGYVLGQARQKRPDARVIALAGNIHAQKTPFARYPDIGLPAAGHLPARETLSFEIAQQGGASWSCEADECGVSPSLVSYDVDARGIIWSPAEDGGFDGVLALGPWTASPPIEAKTQN